MTLSKAGEARKRLNSWHKKGELDTLLPELTALRGVPQPPEFHREGDVYTHTMLALQTVGDQEDERIFWGVLLHDLGKAETTRFEEGRWRARGHVEAGADKVEEIMQRVGREDIGEDVAWLVRYHHFHFSWGEEAGQGLSRRQQRFCRHPLFPLLLRVAEADAAGSFNGGHKDRLLAIIRARAEEVLAMLDRN